MLDLKKLNSRIGFIGPGNMASAMITGLLQQGLAPNNIITSGPHLTASTPLILKTGIQWTVSNTLLAEQVDCIVLSVKPLQLQEVCQELAPFLIHRPTLVISIAAGVCIESLKRWLGTDTCVRAMPNLPAQIGLGMTGILRSSKLSPEHEQLTETILSATGKILWCDAEPIMDVITALSGSGPGFMFAYCEAMIRAGITLGLAEEDARTLCLQTMLGSTQLALNSTLSLSALREQVTSKGGTTAAGLAELMPTLFPLMLTTLEAATTRSAEISARFNTSSRN